MTTRVIGIGRPLAGDDGVGIAVIDALRADPPRGVELHTVHDNNELVSLLMGTDQAVLVDAAVQAGIPGTVRILSTADLEAVPLSDLPSHDLSVPHAIELAHRLSLDTPAPKILIVAIAIGQTLHYRHELSAAIQAAVPVAVDTVRHLV